MLEPIPTVFVVDDDPAMCESLKWLIESVDLTVETYPSASAFLEAYSSDSPGCLVLDVRMPGMSGLELQEILVQRGIPLPVIVITGHGDVPMAVRALKTGAMDFMEKPFNDQELLDRIQIAIEQDKKIRSDLARRTDVATRISRLSSREKEVMNLIVSGNSNKVVAACLGLSPKTVEVHRAHVMDKLQADSLPELVKLAMSAEKEADFACCSGPGTSLV